MQEYRRQTGKKQPKQSFFTVSEKARLMEFLMAAMPDRNRSTVKSLLAHHQVSVDHKITTRFDHLLQPGAQVAVNWGKVQQGSPHKGLRIVFEDPFLIVVEKQPGLLSIATDKERERTAYRILSDQARKTDPKARIFVIHRLDRDASGLMIFAKSKTVQQTLQKAWHEGVFDRVYAVVVEGTVADDNGTITSWLKENRALTMYSSPVPNGGRKAVTHYRVLKRKNNRSLLEVRPETGLKNQVRVHMKDINHSIVGDKKYGASTRPMKRLGLHARVLAFRHPLTGEELRFETPIPKAFSVLLT